MLAVNNSDNLLAANNNDKRKRVKPAEILEGLRSLAQSLGRPPTMKDWDEWEGRPCSVSTVRWVFGSWGEALAAVNMQPVSPRPRQNESLKEVALEGVRELAGKLGRPPTSQEWAAAKMRPCLRTIMKYFGSWRNFLASAGLGGVMQPARGYRGKRIQPEKILEGIRFLAGLVGGTPSARDWKRWEGRPCSLSTVCGYFQSWSRALAAAGVRPPASSRKNREDVRLGALAGVQKLAAELGRSPRMRDWIAAGMRPCLQTIRNYFGSWGNFLKAAGLDPAGERYHSALEAIRKAAQLLGHCPTMKEYNRLRIQQQNHGQSPMWPAPSTFSNIFGSWTKALEAAGVALRLNRKKALVEAKAAELAAAVMDALGPRRVAFPDDLQGIPRGHIRWRVLKILGENGVAYWRNRSIQISRALLLVMDAGFPEVEGCERGRAFAKRVVAGQTLAAIAREEGLTRERVRQLMTNYLERAVRCLGGEVLPGRTRVTREVAVSALRKAALECGEVPSIAEYERMRGFRREWPSVSTLRKLFGSWRKALFEALVVGSQPAEHNCSGDGGGA